MKLDQFNTENLTQEELLSINGGESGWYYLGQVLSAVTDAIGPHADGLASYN